MLGGASNIINNRLECDYMCMYVYVFPYLTHVRKYKLQEGPRGRKCGESSDPINKRLFLRNSSFEGGSDEDG